MNHAVILVVGNLRAEIITEEGGVLSRLISHGQDLLCQTPWSDKVTPSQSPAPDEPTWVNNWRGGWQLCAPSTGMPAPSSLNPAFHGSASQANWEITGQDDFSVDLRWLNSTGEFEIRRSWLVRDPETVVAKTIVFNHSESAQEIGVAEHLILGSNFLEPIRSGKSANIQLCSEAKIVDLDYTGAPTGLELDVANAQSSWTELTKSQPARVYAVASSKVKEISVGLEGWQANISWEGLDHALIWQEFGTSQESPWSGEVFALGIEPTNIAHGLGANQHTGPFIQAGQKLSWSTSLQLTRKVVS